MSRRRLLGSMAVAVGGVLARELAAAPSDAGPPAPGLVGDRSGFRKRTVMPLAYRELPGFLTHAQLAIHHAEYAGDLERLKEAERGLREPDVKAERYTALRRAQVAAANGLLLHELYFGHLSAAKAGKTARPPDVERLVAEHMGSWEHWVDDFTRCAVIARAWALLVYDPYDDRCHNVLMDDDGDGVWMGANPLVVCDVADHAFAEDYAHREEYVASFLAHVDWGQVSRRYRTASRR